MKQVDLSIYTIVSFVIMEFKISTLFSQFKKDSIFLSIVFLFLAIYTSLVLFPFLQHKDDVRDPSRSQLCNLCLHVYTKVFYLKFFQLEILIESQSCVLLV